MAEALGFSRPETVSDWERDVSAPDGDVLLKVSELAGKTYAEVFGGVGGTGASTAEAVRREAAAHAGAAGVMPEGAEPSLQQLDWMPRLMELVLRDPQLTAAEKAALMGEINAGGMRYWAVAAEWAGGQRGKAMARAEISSENRGSLLRSEPGGIRNLPPTLDLIPQPKPGEGPGEKKESA